MTGLSNHNNFQPASDRSSNHDLSDSPKLIVAESSRLNGEAIAWCLSAYGNFRNVETVGTTEELLSAIRAQRPALVLIGERVVAQGILQVLQEVSVNMGETRVAVFADSLADRQLDLIVDKRVTGFVSRQESMRNLNEQLLRIAAGTPVLAPQLNDRVELTKSGRFRCKASSLLRKFSPRQWDVLVQIAKGRRVSEVATDLEISSKAVESHKYRIMKTIGADDRVGLCRWAIREGLIDA
ncbi:MAG: response regulator transcription factor [Fuerstiella sp.]